MLTVYFVFHQYCKDHEIPPPTSEDLKNAGGMIGHHFRNYWGLQNPDEVRHAGFVLSQEEGCIVIGYPDSFLIEMYRRIGHYRQMQKDKMNKAAEKPNSPPTEAISDHKKERRRKPTQPPAFSGKPLMNKKQS